jgi:hypothetical protein
MSSPPSPSDSVLRDRALRSASLLRERERRAAREPSFDSRIEEGELLNIPDHHDDDAVPGPSSVSDHRYRHRRSSHHDDDATPGPSSVSDHRYRHRRSSVDSHSRAGRSHSRSRSPLRRPPVEPSAESFVVSESKTRLLRKWMVQGIPKSECKSLRHAYAPSFDGDFDLLCPKLDETMVRYWKQAVGKDWRSNLNDFQEKSWQSVQYQVLDSFRPLLRTWNQLPEGSPFLKDMEDSLKLLGAAFAGISKLRRANAMRHVAPDLLPLLKDDRMFSSREFERLFGEKFLTAMVKDADDFEKVKKFAGRSGGPFPTRSENRGSNGQGGHGYRALDSRYPPTSSGARRGGQGFTPSSTKSQQQSSRYVPSPFISFPVGNRLSRFGVAWSLFSTDPWILSTVFNGYFIDFIDLPFQHSAPAGCVMSQDMVAVCDQEIHQLLNKGAISLVSPNSGDGFISNLFVIPKKSGGWRPIINLKRLNSFIRYKHFKMEGLDCVRYLLQRGDWMVKLDLQDAYFLVGLFPDHRKYVRFFWKNSIYEYSCLLFGLCSAPRVFTKLLRPVVAYLRERGIRLVIYLDDILIFNSSKAALLHDLRTVVNLLLFLGFVINYDKSVTTPLQIMDYLGVVVDSLRLSFSLPSAKVDSIIALCKAVLVSSKVKLRDLAKLMENFSWSISSVPFAQGHFRKLQHFYLSHSHGDLNVSVSLSHGAKSDLEWWVNHLQQSNGKSFFPDQPDLVIYSDASLHGWRAVCDQTQTRGPWTIEDQSRHINELELLGAFFALQVFTAASHDI